MFCGEFKMCICVYIYFFTLRPEMFTFVFLMDLVSISAFFLSGVLDEMVTTSLSLLKNMSTNTLHMNYKGFVCIINCDCSQVAK